MRWRIALAVIIAVAVTVGFLPHAALSAGSSATAQAAQAVQAPFGGVTNCADAVCGKGSPAPPAPAPALTLAAMIGGLAVVAIAAARLRRRPAHVVPLPAGTPDPPFHPPQFS